MDSPKDYLTTEFLSSVGQCNTQTITQTNSDDLQAFQPLEAQIKREH